MNPPINPDENEFAAFAKATKAAVLPLIFRAPNDGVLAWAAFAALEDLHPFAFLLESADGGEGGRYSYMGCAPRRLFVFADGVFSVKDGANDKTFSQNKCEDPLRALQSQMESSQTFFAGEGLPPFAGGAVGYMAYDCAHYFEPVGKMKQDVLNVPEMIWMQTDLLTVFDHRRHEVYIIKSCYAEDGEDAREMYRRGRMAAENLLARLSAAKTARLHFPQTKTPRPLKIESNMTEEKFCGVVDSFKQHIRAGDIFQGVPSQRLSFPLPAPTLDIYRHLRRMNPSPYMFYLKCGDFVAAGASPELMISKRGRRVSLRPIAGTRPRGDTPESDKKLEKELLADEKEIAEHLMLVDLARNDLGRVAKAATVRVPRFCAVERFSHVMHIVSAAEGELQDGCSAFDGLRAAFPAGTLSGAPKVRAMQLINRYETSRRNIYGGCVGCAGFDGDMTACIAIRSFVAKDGFCYVQAGGGVVADSSPQNEYKESMAKAAAVLRAAEAAAEERGSKT